MHDHSTQPNHAPLCPGCGARHYPGIRGNGRAVWCDGTDAEPRPEPTEPLDLTPADIPTHCPEDIR